MGGVIVGMLWGVIVSGVVLGALSLSSPLPPRAASLEETPAPISGEAPETSADPQPDTPAPEDMPARSGLPATEVPLPSGSEFNRPPPEPEAALPSPDAAPQSASPAAPVLVGDGAQPNFDTAPLPLPTVNAVAPSQGPGARLEGARILLRPDATPDPSAPAAQAQPAQLAAPAIDSARLPQIAVTTPAPAPTPDVPEEVEEAVAPDADAAAAVEPQPAEPAPAEIAPAQLPQIAAGAEAGEAMAETAPRLPQVAPASGTAPAFPTVAPATEPDPEEPSGDMRAIDRFAVPFEGDRARPLIGVVLIDVPDSQIDISTLTQFTIPVAFAIDPMHPDAAERAQIYRDAGFEVVLLGSMIPEGATATDTEVALAAALQVVPESIAMLDTPEGRIQGDRPVLDAVVAALADDGLGLMAFPRGLNAAEQSASRADVPAMTLFRLLDDEDQRATVITRFLARAAFTASQEGAVIVAGRAQPDTVTALFSWALADRTEGVTIAPVSAVLLRGTNG